MNYNNTLMELYRVYLLKDANIKCVFLHNIKMKYYKKKLKKVIRKKVRDGKLCFVEYEWILEKLAGADGIIHGTVDLFLHYGLNSYYCHIQDKDLIQLDIKKYEYNVYKQKNDLTDISMRLRFSVPVRTAKGQIEILLDTGHSIYSDTLSDILLFTDTEKIENFIRYLGKKNSPIDSSYYIPLHSIMVNLIERIFELEE